MYIGSISPTKVEYRLKKLEKKRKLSISVSPPMEPEERAALDSLLEVFELNPANAPLNPQKPIDRVNIRVSIDNINTKEVDYSGVKSTYSPRFGRNDGVTGVITTEGVARTRKLPGDVEYRAYVSYRSLRNFIITSLIFVEGPPTDRMLTHDEKTLALACDVLKKFRPHLVELALNSSNDKVRNACRLDLKSVPGKFSSCKSQIGSRCVFEDQ